MVTQLTWKNFSSTFIVEGENRSHHVGDNPPVDIFFDGSINRVGLLVGINPGDEIPERLQRLALVDVSKVQNGEQLYLRATIDKATLFQSFYHFAVAVADRIYLDGENPFNAVSSEVASLEELTGSKLILSDEKQIGLLGELMFLLRVIENRGSHGLASWIGPLSEPHDFRLSESELEVKTTTKTRRIHTISSLAQLEPSKEHPLFILSIMLGPAGDGPGQSLSGIIATLRSILQQSSEIKLFEKHLRQLGYMSENDVFYRKTYSLRKPFAVIPVLPPFPAISQRMLKRALGGESSRIGNVHYEINLEGLEHEEGSPVFKKALKF